MAERPKLIVPQTPHVVSELFPSIFPLFKTVGVVIVGIVPENKSRMTRERLEDGNGGGNSNGDDGWPCHCQGGRLLVLMGPMGLATESGVPAHDPQTGLRMVMDEAMYSAQKWALGFYERQRAINAHIHMLRYDSDGKGAPSATSLPRMPVDTADPAESVALRPGKAHTFPETGYSWRQVPDVIRSLDHTLPDCCCFFTEVLLICHGEQGANGTFVTETLPKVMAGRPVEKFVFWSCRSSRHFSPSEPNNLYQMTAWVFRPRACPCGCECAVCKAFDPDCKKRHCPDGKKATTILTSGALNGVPVPLGLNADSKTNPFASPDGRVRVITIQPDGTTPASQQVTADLSPANHEVEVFGGAKTAADPTITPADAANPNPGAEAEYRRKALKDCGVKEPPHAYKGYSGPTVNLCDCLPQEGCLLGDTCSGPD